MSAQKLPPEGKFKIREFEWFEMETRVRQMVQELIAPFQKRVLEASSGINNLRAFTSQQALKLEQLRLLVTSDPNNKEVDVFKQIDNKIDKNSMEILEVRQLIEQQNNLVDSRFKMQEERHRENNEILNLNMQLKERVNTEIIAQNNNITELRTQLQKMIQDLGTNLQNLRKDHQDQQQRGLERQNNIDIKMTKIKEWEDGIEARLKIFDEKNLGLHRKQIHLEQEFRRIDRELEDLNNSAAYTKKLANYVQDIEEKLRIQEHSIQTMTPLITQAQIGDTLYNILPPKLKRRLVVQENVRYQKLNQDVLENDYKTSKERFRGLELLEMVQKRNTREVIDMKRKKLVALGIDIDNITYEQRQKYYKEVNLNEADFEGEDQQIKIKPGIDQAQIVRIIQQHISDYQKHLSQKVLINLEDSKNYIMGMEEDLSSQLRDMQVKIDATKESLNTFETDQLLQNKFVKQSLDNYVLELDAYKGEIRRLDENMFSFIQFCSLVNHLQIQDELDKQSISLFGVRESFNETGSKDKQAMLPEPRRIIDFNQNCFSCCGYPASTIAAFKMACLTYNPSDIVIEDRQYKRQEILEISTKILQYIKNRLLTAAQPESAGTSSQLQHRASQQQPNNISGTIHEEINKYKSSNGRINNLKNPSTIQGTEKDPKSSETKWRRTRRINTSHNHNINNSSFNGKMVVMSRSSIKSASQHKDVVSIASIFSENKRKNLQYLS